MNRTLTHGTPLLVGVALLVGASTTFAAAPPQTTRPAAKAPACGTGTYLVNEAPFLTMLPDGGKDAIVLNDGMVLIAGCTPTPAKIRKVRKGTRLRVRWASCPALGGAVELRLAIDPSCRRVRGVVRAGRKHRKRFTANAMARVAIAVDPTVLPPMRQIAGVGDEAPRPVAALTDGAGTTTSFVENELIVVTNDDAALAAFAQRWGGTVLRHYVPSDYGLEGDRQHLVRIDASRADATRLADDLAALNAGKVGRLAVSSDAGLGLVAAATHEAAAGVTVGLNFVMESTSFRDGNVTESASAPKMLNGVEPYSSNPSNWSYMQRGGAQNIGVSAAWRALDFSGHLVAHQVLVAVIDGGFMPTDDNPVVWVNFNSSLDPTKDPYRPNENTCTGRSQCPWHGTNVMGTLMGVADNGKGAAGPAGPVADAITIRMGDDVFSNLIALGSALYSKAFIVNMSFGGSVPALLTWSVIPFDVATRAARYGNMLLVAAAGNDGNDDDAEDCAWPFDWPCWERAWYVPCENGGVTCVGALAHNSDQRRSDSNYGHENVDLFGPGYVWVGPDQAIPTTHQFEATSAASPFVAGVAALVYAAHPGLSANAIEDILIDTANPSRDGSVRRYVNAYDAVIRALGGTPPEISITVAPDQRLGSCQTEFRLTATVSDPDSGPPVVTWKSDRDGALGTGAVLVRQLSDGTHRITATAVNGIGLASSAEIVLPVANGSTAPRPTIEILSLTNHQTFVANQSVTFEAGGLDPNGALVAANMRWVSSLDGELGSGQRIFRTLSPGAHYIYVYYTAICGGTADDVRLIQVNPAVTDGPPNMVITTPSANNLVLYASGESGEACLHVAGFGYDEEDQDFATIEWWETDRSDLQYKVLSFDQNTTVCLKLGAGGVAATHKVRLRGRDNHGHVAYSSPLLVTVLPGLH